MPDPHNRSFAVLHGPHSPSNSDSPLSLVVRKDEDPRFRTDAVHRKAHGDSPGRSSGFSDGGYGSSPNRSPNQEPYGSSGHHHNTLNVKLIFQDDSSRSNDGSSERTREENEKPLSLVIRKNLSHFRDPNANVPEYTVHPRLPDVQPLYPRPAEGGRDSGAECDSDPTTPRPTPPSSAPPSHHTLPIPIPPSLPREREHQLTRVQVIPGAAAKNKEKLLGFSSGEEKPTPIVPNVTLTTVPRRESIVDPEQIQPADGEIVEKGSCSSKSAAAGIKIKDFAKLLDNGSEAGPPPPPSPKSSRHPSCDNAAARPEPEEFSDVSSECPSVSSVDTWSSSMVEGKPYSYGSDVVIRRVSRSSTGEPMYQCDFCDKLFANKYHLQSHLVTHTGERAFNCRVCKKTFGRKSTLRAHMTTHTKKSNFMCPVCEKACNDNNSLEEHMRMHTGSYTFVSLELMGIFYFIFQAKNRSSAPSAPKPTRASPI